ncbi:hypothetical protein OKA04_07910 [Luteolibacter flavescens]|uniref:HEAT repeat domain-containing protein n=1 Tax=Luteolibacter flavescens TaxID=1859460 RepID=A0ABT3FM50_9BACT|nr:hypothetical protein [Luteolibacter flavescens]MCW1884652.1 hypothetical protein [Luteolibacter flavescens]
MPDSAAPAYPLEKAAVARALVPGHGRATARAGQQRRPERHGDGFADVAFFPRACSTRSHATVRWQEQDVVPMRSREAFPLEQCLEQILTSATPVQGLSDAGELATPDERRTIAFLDFDKLGPAGLVNYLSFFDRTGFPEIWEEHLPLLSHLDEEVRRQAHSTMSHHADPELRMAAYETLARGEVLNFVTLLHRHARPVDIGPMLEAVSAPGAFADDDELRSAVLRLLDLAGEQETIDPRILIWIYKHSPCRMCRREAVDLMADRSVLPRWIAEECLALQ